MDRQIADGCMIDEMIDDKWMINDKWMIDNEIDSIQMDDREDDRQIDDKWMIDRQKNRQTDRRQIDRRQMDVSTLHFIHLVPVNGNLF